MVRTGEHLTTKATIEEEAQVEACEGEAIGQTDQEVRLLVTELLLTTSQGKTLFVGDDLTVELAGLIFYALVARTPDFTVLTAFASEDLEVVIRTEVVFGHGRLYPTTIIELDDAVFVVRKVELRIPLEGITTEDISRQHQLDPLVLDITSIDHLSFVATGRVHTEADELVRSIRAIPSEVNTEAAIEEAHFQP